MTTRLGRKNRNDIIYKMRGGLTDMLDDIIKESLRINDEEYDYIIETDDGITSVLGLLPDKGDTTPLNLKKRYLTFINNKIDEYHNNTKK